jgi:hypothetical protein
MVGTDMVFGQPTTSTPSASSSTTIVDWIQGIASAVAAIVAIILLKQLHLLGKQLHLMREQVEQSAEAFAASIQWNKINAAFTYFSSEVILKSERAASKALESVGFDVKDAEQPLGQDNLAKLKENLDYFYDVKDFLNLLEDYCTAVQAGAIDEDAAYAMNSGFIVRFQYLLEPFIVDRKEFLKDPEVYCELEKLATTWRARDKERLARRDEKVAEADRRLQESQGVDVRV